MKTYIFSFILMPFLLLCGEKERDRLDDLNRIKREFINSIFSENVDESPFNISYTFRTVFFSKEIISLFGEIMVYDHLPHGWSRHEGKTFCKIEGKFKEITLNDLFCTDEQKEFLRSYCENVLKKDHCSYFSGKSPLYDTLDQNFIKTFVIDDKCLRIIFQPYSVAGGYDGPVHVSIPYEDLMHHWNDSNPIAMCLLDVLATKEYTSSWDEKAFWESLNSNVQ